jgi:hypothetical protein
MNKGGMRTYEKSEREFTGDYKRAEDPHGKG